MQNNTYCAFLDVINWDTQWHFLSLHCWAEHSKTCPWYHKWSLFLIQTISRKRYAKLQSEWILPNWHSRTFDTQSISIWALLKISRKPYMYCSINLMLVKRDSSPQNHLHLITNLYVPQRKIIHDIFKNVGYPCFGNLCLSLWHICLNIFFHVSQKSWGWVNGGRIVFFIFK